MLALAAHFCAGASLTMSLVGEHLSLSCKRWTGRVIAGCVLLGTCIGVISCGDSAASAQKQSESSGSQKADQPESNNVSVATVQMQPLQTTLTLSSELVPFQEIDVYAKESGYVKQLLVDYGTHVRQGQVLAVLEIPELQAQIEQDQASIKAASHEVSRADQNVQGYEAQANVADLIYQRLNGVAEKKPGLVAQQEVDDAQGKDLSAKAQVAGAKSNLESAESQLAVSRAKLKHDQDLYQYSRITAPFDGFVTQRYANLGALMQAGTTSIQAMPLVRLSQENLFRLSIPVPESDVRYIHVGDQVQVRVPSLAKTLLGHVARLSVQVAQDTRTMYTEVDVENPNRELMPGLYAEAILTLQDKHGAAAVPLQAVDRQGARAMVDAIDQNNKVQVRDVTLGIETSDYAEVLSGLKEGDRVIVSDRSALRPGDVVNPRPAEHMAYSNNTSDKR